MLDELETVEELLGCLNRQRDVEFSLWVCVNQPEEWHQSANQWERKAVDANEATLSLLRKVDGINLIDRSSVGCGWVGKQRGVGWARKTLFDQIASCYDEDELIVSLDADTLFASDYLANILDAMNRHSDSSAIAVPYWHILSGEEPIDRRMLRYECYMRHYMLNMLAIESPYAFTALGSAIVFPLWAYKKVRGITPLQGGEDFYLMQKFAKTGRVELLGGLVQPQGRSSQRVPFGTGPAVSLSMEEQAVRYPFYSAEAFANVYKTCQMFEMLYERDVDTPLTQFLQQQIKTSDIWEPLRSNYRSRDKFVRACNERLDGLRILQYLKTQPIEQDPIDFASAPFQSLLDLRQAMYDREMELRRKTGSVGLG